MLKVLLFLATLLQAEIMTCTTENVQQILRDQLLEFDKPVKKQKGLILVFVLQRQSTALEFHKVV